MNLTIIPSDGSVYIDGESIGNMNLSFIPEGIHALQWKNSHGWIEYSEDESGIKKPNEKITQLPDWVDQALKVWDTAKKEIEQEFLASQVPVNYQ